MLVLDVVKTLLVNTKKNNKNTALLLFDYDTMLNGFLFFLFFR